MKIERSNKKGITTELERRNDGSVGKVTAFRETMSDFLKRVAEIEYQEAIRNCQS